MLGAAGRAIGRGLAAFVLALGLTAGAGVAEEGFLRLEGHGGPVKAVAVSPEGGGR